MYVVCYYNKDYGCYVAVAQINLSLSLKMTGKTPKEALRSLRKIANEISRKCSKELANKKALQSSEETKDL